MVFQFDQDFFWRDLFGFGGVALVVVLGLIFIFVKMPDKLMITTVITALVVVIGAIAGVLGQDFARQAQHDANFSKQLMDEYHASSNRSLAEIQSDFARYNESNVIFTKDGKDTAVSIKRTDIDREQVTMVFTVIDEKTLYPKSIK